jgi:adenosylcobyric acid synthase
MSNFTDFNVFDTIDGVSLCYVTRKEELENADIVIIPGSKSTIDDMLYLRESGMENAILKHYKKGGYVFGICGGLQILGQTIEDPFLTESEMKEIHGMGLLDIATTIEEEKVTTQAAASINDAARLFDKLSDRHVEGYEIHMGSTRITGESKSFMSLSNIPGRENDIVGVMSKDEKVLGTYLHGIFDNMNFTLHIINMLRKARGIDLIAASEDYRSLKEKEYDKLAQVLRESLDMGSIYRIINEKQ